MKLSKYLLFFSAAVPVIAFAHVKWFSNFDFRQPPLEINQLLNLTFWGLLLLSLVSLPVLVLADKTFEQSGFYRRINHFLDRYSGNASLIMRIATGAVLLMSWQSRSHWSHNHSWRASSTVREQNPKDHCPHEN